MWFWIFLVKATDLGNKIAYSSNAFESPTSTNSKTTTPITNSAPIELGIIHINYFLYFLKFLYCSITNNNLLA